MGDDLKGRKVKPASKNADREDWRVIATEAITTDDILYIAGVEGQFFKVAVADKDTAASARGLLLVAKGNQPEVGGELRAAPIACLDVIDTSGSAVGNPVYLSDAGAHTLTRPTTGVVRRVGSVAKVGAAGTGEVIFDGRATNQIISGTAEVANAQSTVTVTAATLGGNFGGMPVVASMMENDGTAVTLESAAWSGHDLVITLTGATAAARTIGFLISID
jgi:hypothetical protein